MGRGKKLAHVEEEKKLFSDSVITVIEERTRKSMEKSPNADFERELFKNPIPIRRAELFTITNSFTGFCLRFYDSINNECTLEAVSKGAYLMSYECLGVHGNRLRNECRREMALLKI